MLVEIEVSLKKPGTPKIIQETQQILNVDVIVSIEIPGTASIELFQAQNVAIAIVVDSH